MTDAIMVVEKVGSGVLSKVSQKMFNWACKKWWPLDPKNILLQFTHNPQAFVNYEHHNNEINLYFTLKNFTRYHIQVLAYKCEIVVSSSVFMTLDGPLYVELPKGKHIHINPIVKPLSDSNIRRIKEIMRGQDMKPTQFNFTFTIQSRFGIREIHIESGAQGLLFTEFGKPQLAIAHIRTE